MAVDRGWAPAALVGVLCISTAVAAGCRQAPQPAAVREDLPVPVGAVAAERAQIRAVVRAVGTVTPSEGAEFLVFAPEPARIAEVLKAETQLAAESGHGQASPRSPTSLSPPPSISLPKSEAATLRSADDFRRNLQDLELSLAAAQARAPRVGQTEAEYDQERKFRIGRYQRDLAFLREEYAAQIRLLELEVQDASSAVEAAGQQLKQTHQEFESGQGTLGVLTRDDQVARDLKEVTASLKEVASGLQKGQGTAGKLLSDDALYQKLDVVATRLDSVTAKLEKGDGTAGRLLQDAELYSNLNSAAREMRALMSDIRKDPQKYLRVKVSLF